MNLKSIQQLALKLPDGEAIDNPADNPVVQITNLGNLLSGLLNIALLLAAFLTFYWLVWGAFQYILAKGDKEALAKATERIRWAIIGFLVTISAYLIATFAGEIFPAKIGGLPF